MGSRELGAGSWELGCTHYLGKEDVQEGKRTCSLRNPAAPGPLWSRGVIISEWTMVTVGSHIGEAGRGVLRKGISPRAGWEPGPGSECLWGPCKRGAHEAAGSVGQRILWGLNAAGTGVDLVPDCLGLKLGSALTCCVALGMLLHLSGPHFLLCERIKVGICVQCSVSPI